MTENHKKLNDENDELRSLGVPDVRDSFAAENPVEFTCRYLHHADPARLLLHGGFALIVGAILTVLNIYGGIEGALVWGIGALIFISGIVGSMLPLWAVGRLISDAIKAGAKHE